ncbi:hypothetical protein AB1Y20_006181 [Prymnesium parvum]|uniref:Uncharacterized protein n=1 Tax=Prymnesium parvum TaxID=97485 RepID=A0AB34J3F5_PRYPA
MPLALTTLALALVRQPFLLRHGPHSPRLPAAPHMLDSPLSTVVAPLRKFEPSGDAVARSGDLLTGLPIEVALLFGAILLVGVAGLVKQSGILRPDAPTVGLGESRESVAPRAAAAAEEEDAEPLTQAEQEKKYFAILAEEAKTKRGGSAQKRKKKKQR